MTWKNSVTKWSCQHTTFLETAIYYRRIKTHRIIILSDGFNRISHWAILFFLQVLRSLMQKQRSWWLLRRLYNILQTRKTFMNNLFYGSLQRQVYAGSLFFKLQCNFIFLLQKVTSTGSTCIASNVSHFCSPKPHWLQYVLFNCI